MPHEDDKLASDLREAFGGESASFGQADLFAGPVGSKSRSGESSSGADREMIQESSIPLGTILDDFEVISELGRGGMGIVYRAHQKSLGREVALKVLPGYAMHGRMAVKRFRTEAQAAARLSHTNIVSIYAQGEHDGHFYYAMELVDGVGLDVVVRSKPELLSSTWAARSIVDHEDSTAVLVELREESGEAIELDAEEYAERSEKQLGEKSHPERSAVPRSKDDYRYLARLLADVADGLHHAHQQGVIHRDIKPHNLLLGSSVGRGAAAGLDSGCWRLHIADFGLARLIDQPHVTVPGEVMGTPSYLSPEQLGGKGTLDHRTDIYSFGVTMYEVLTGRCPFEGKDRHEVIARICRDEPRSLRSHDRRIPLDLETICLRAMDKDPQCRYSSADALAEDLRRFADGRPILSRRTSLLEKALKWMKRRRAATAAIAACLAAVVLFAGLAASISSSRRSEVSQLLDRVYERLVFMDYRQVDEIDEDLTKAERLGINPQRVSFLRALEHFANSRHEEAVASLESIVADDPENAEALYALAWLNRKIREHETSREIFARAEALGEPRSAEAWFFRGLAIHFYDPDIAIESYRKANAVRASEHEFYPFAVLHLARAHNQQMYKTRRIDTFSEAEASLLQLIEHNHYGAFPHYLLSISHRLAAEVYQGSEGTRDDSLVEYHFEQSLFWAREGQRVDPQSDRPVTAEAECLERLGLFEEAIEARTRAIGLAQLYIKKCEGHHYRWRLHFWSGHYEDALSDIDFHRGCDPKSRFYAHLYPALVHAAAGEEGLALEHARSLATDSPTDPMAVIWSASALRLLGHEEEASALLEERAAFVDFELGANEVRSSAWQELLYEHCAGEAEVEELYEMADQVDQPWRLRGEASFHSGARALSTGDIGLARMLFGRSYRSFDGEENYTFHAKIVLEKMDCDSGWPGWVKKQKVARHRPGGTLQRPYGHTSDQKSRNFRAASFDGEEHDE